MTKGMFLVVALGKELTLIDLLRAQVRRKLEANQAKLSKIGQDQPLTINGRLNKHAFDPSRRAEISNLRANVPGCERLNLQSTHLLVQNFRALRSRMIPS